MRSSETARMPATSGAEPLRYSETPRIAPRAAGSPPVLTRIACSRETFTAAAVIGAPSEKRTSCRSRSLAARPPSASCHSSARSGTRFPSWSVVRSVSKTFPRNSCSSTVWNTAGIGGGDGVGHGDDERAAARERRPPRPSRSGPGARAAPDRPPPSGTRPGDSPRWRRGTAASRGPPSLRQRRPRRSRAPPTAGSRPPGARARRSPPRREWPSPRARASSPARRPSPQLRPREEPRRRSRPPARPARGEAAPLPPAPCRPATPRPRRSRAPPSRRAPPPPG